MRRSGNVSISQVFLILVLVALVGLLGYQLLSDSGASPTPEKSAEKSEPLPPPTGEEKQPAGPIETDEGPKEATPTPGPSLPVPRTTRPLTGKPTEIAGIVHDNEGRPIAGATVILFRYDTDMKDESKRLVERFKEVPLDQRITGKDGVYTFPNLPRDAALYVRANARGYIGQIKDAVKIGALADFHLLPGSRVIGRVVDAKTKQGLSNALVKGWYSVGGGGSNFHTAFRWEEKVYTKDDGSFEIPGAPQSSVKWLIYHSDYEDLVEDRTIIAGLTNELEFGMTRGVDVVGIVTDLMSEQPIARVKVTTTTQFIPEKTVYTDENGVFRINGLKSGMQAFSFLVDGYTAARVPTTIGRDNNYDPAQDNKLAFRLEPSGRAAGVVLSADGAPVANAKVFLVRKLPIFNAVRAAPNGQPGTPEMVTGADGRFLIGNIGTDIEHQVVVMHDGLGFGVSKAIQVGADETVEGLTVRLTEGGFIEGRVLNEDGAPVVDADVFVEVPPFRDAFFGPGATLGQGGPRQLKTGPDGAFLLDRLWAGTYTFRLMHPGHVPLDDQKVVLQENNEAVSREFRMRIGRSISGYCAIQGAGNLKDVQVHISRAGTSETVVVASCDESGFYQADALVKGNYSLQAKLPGFSSPVQENVPADARNVNLTLIANGGISGIVASNVGGTVEEFTVTVAPYRGEDLENVLRSDREALAPKSFRDPGGIFLFEDLSPGRYVMTVRARGFAPVTVRDINVPSGFPADVGRIEVGRGGRLFGTLLDTKGSGVVTATITAINLNMGGLEGLAGEKLASKAGARESGEDGGGGAFGTASFQSGISPSGEWSIVGLPEGRYRVSVRSSSHVVPDDEVIEVRNDEIRRDWTLAKAGRVAITVVDDQGQPVPSVIAAVTRADTGARVRLPAGSGRSTMQGLLEVSGLAPGEYRIQLTRSGYLVTEVQVTMPEGGSIERQEVLEKVLR